MKLKNIIVSLFLSITVFSCIHVPTKNQSVLDEITLAAGQTNTLYENIMSNSDKSYDIYANQYSNIDSEIADLISKDAARPHSKIITSMMNDVRTLFSQFEADHKSRTLNNSQILIHQDQMAQAWKSVINAENSYK